MSRLLPVGRYSRNQRPLTGLKRGRVSAARLFRIVQSRERYAELMAPAIKAAQVTVERVLQELQRLAFYDMTAVLQVAVGKITLRDPASLPEDLRRGLADHGGPHPRRDGDRPRLPW